jgi:hypothetical protein
VTVADKGIPSWPKVTIRLYDDHNAEVKIAGRGHPINHHDPRQAAIALVTERAAQLGRPIKATAVEPDGASWPLIIHPDGQVEAVEVEVRNNKPIWPIVAAAVLAVILIGGTMVYLLVLRSPGEQQVVPTVSPTLPELPGPKVGPDQFAARPVPPGWSANASWTVDIAENTSPAVSPDGSQVAIINTDNKITVFDSFGKVLWQDEVPRDSSSPVFTTIDLKPVVAISAPKTLKYWPGEGALPTELELPVGARVQFFGSSPLVVQDDGTASLVSGDQLHPVTNQPRLSTVLLAEDDKALMARYRGPLFWSQSGKDLVQLDLKPPAGARSINRIVAASRGRVVVQWNTGSGDTVIPTVNSTANGALIATCPKVSAGETGGWEWVPDQAGKVAAYGECLISFTGNKTFPLDRFQPLSVTGTTLYGRYDGGLAQVVPGGKRTPLSEGTARPWGIAGNHAIVVHESVLYALDKAGAR